LRLRVARTVQAGAALLALCAALWPCAAARAHQQRLSYGEVKVAGAEASVRLRFALGDLTGVVTLPWSDPPAPGEVEQKGPQVAQALLSEFSVRADGAPCALAPGATVAFDGASGETDGLAVTTRYQCPRAIETLEVRVGLLEQLAPGHVHLAKVSFESDAAANAERVVQRDTPGYTASRQRGSSALRFARLGVEHIFTGTDHLAFLLGLLLLGGTLGGLVKIVTSFTVAHSLTLALATLGLLSPPSRIIEPLIAASVVFVAVENLWALRRGTAEAALSHRWLLTFAFGLVHGFGFADALRELHLPRESLLAALLAFNLGVEAGQLCLVLLALPLLALLRRRGLFGRPEAAAISAVILASGVYWLAGRV
jgi:hypothetical protein